ncbi:MAG: L-threonylcarbamoyladenylate synthase [Paracoccaceae bacterium]|nr:L-threonylcarbamoyladenylate synthase [Paracoccaceae bacterium]
MQKNINTEILNQDMKSLRKACYFLNKNELVSFPTETVYGLGASAISNIGVAKIFSVKGRPKYNPLIIHIANKQDADKWAQVPKEAELLIESFWPGPLTLVLNRKKPFTALSTLVTGNLETIAIRVPLHPTARALIKEFGSPLAAPSANISGRISPTRAKDVLVNMDGKISALIKGDDCSIGLESTIVSFANNEPVLLRPGGLPEEIIEEKLGRPLLKSTQVLSNQRKIIAPGMMESHYAPNCNLKLNQVNSQTNELFLGFGDMPKNAIGLNLSLTRNLKEAATNFFATLTDIDTMAELMRYKTVCVAPIPNLGLGVAINDRLKRAAIKKES